MKDDYPKIAILILAAGASSRMGEPKQLLAWGKSTLLNHAIAQALLVSDTILTILGAHQDVIAPTLTNSQRIIFNPNWKEGMGTSIARGIATLQQQDNFEAILIMLADQPLIDAKYLKELTALHFNSGSKITATSYGTRKGVPAVFHNSLFKELGKLNKDYGAKMLMKRFASDLTSLDPCGREVDIDTRETYLRLFNKHHKPLIQ